MLYTLSLPGKILLVFLIVFKFFDSLTLKPNEMNEKMKITDTKYTSLYVPYETLLQRWNLKIKNKENVKTNFHVFHSISSLLNFTAPTSPAQFMIIDVEKLQKTFYNPINFNVQMTIQFHDDFRSLTLFSCVHNIFSLLKPKKMQLFSRSTDIS